MLIPHDKLLAATLREYERMKPLLTSAGVQASAGMGVGHALNLLATRERGGHAALVAQQERLVSCIAQVCACLVDAAPATGELVDLAVEAGQPLPAEQDAAEQTLRHLFARFEICIADLTASGAVADLAGLVGSLAAWEAADLSGQIESIAGAAANDYAITQNGLEAYLRDRFRDAGLTVTAFAPLPGGFGKETILFSTTGTELDGDFVMRRDPGGNDSLTNDCHQVALEYPVIQAVHAAGFPAPEALWLDVEHSLLPGGDFIVMRKSPGKMLGDIFGASAALPEQSAELLGNVAARLHVLPSMRGLGNLASFIKEDLWDLSRSEAVRRYIAGWYDYYRGEVHTPSPALCALFSWLLDNVPDRPGRSVLLHGDFGFNNFLFEGEELSAVLDWEFAHVGDPAEELGYIAASTEGFLDWSRIMEAYTAAGGDPVDLSHLRYFRIWAQVRNAAAGNILAARFSDGPVDDVKLTILPFHHFPRFVSEASRLIVEAEAERRIE